MGSTLTVSCLCAASRSHPSFLSVHSRFCSAFPVYRFNLPCCPSTALCSMSWNLISKVVTTGKSRSGSRPCSSLHVMDAGERQDCVLATRTGSELRHSSEAWSWSFLRPPKPTKMYFHLLSQQTRLLKCRRRTDQGFSQVHSPLLPYSHV